MSITVGTDSYIELADCTAYMTARLYSTAWDDAVDADREAALKMATRAIDRLVLRGVKKDTDQVLQFPRCYLVDPRFRVRTMREAEFDEVHRTGYLCDVDTPQVVLDAVCEEALALLDRGNSSRYRLQADGVESFSVGSLSESYRGGRPQLISFEAREFMRPYTGAVGIS